MSKYIIVKMTGDHIKIKGGEYVRDYTDEDITYCNNCRYCEERGTYDCPSGFGYLYCEKKNSIVDRYDYCSWGEDR